MGRALEGRDEYEGTSCEIEKRAIGMANISMIGRCKKVDSFFFHSECCGKKCAIFNPWNWIMLL